MEAKEIELRWFIDHRGRRLQFRRRRFYRDAVGNMSDWGEWRDVPTVFEMQERTEEGTEADTK